MSQSFEDILNKRDDEIEAPKPLPVGEYIWLVNGPHRQDKSAQKQTDFVEFQCMCQQALDSVDPEALQATGGCQGKQRRLTFYITEDAVYRLRDFLFDHLGIESGLTLREALSQAPGRTFVGTIRHQPSQDGTRIYDNISTTAAV